MVKENNRNGGDVKLFPKIISIASLLKNEPSTSHRSENWPSPRSRDLDKDTTFPSSPKEGDPLNKLDLPNKQQDNGRRQCGDVSLFAGGVADESHRERTVSAQVIENFLTKDSETSDNL